MTVNLTRIYTKRGDTGETDLGDMSRVSKLHPRVEAYGTVDELNAVVGLTADPTGPARSASPSGWRGCRTTSSTSAPTCRSRRRPTRARAPARGCGSRLLHRLAGGGVRRGQRDAGAAALVRDPGRHAGRGPPAPGPHRLPPGRAAGDRGRGRQPRGVRYLNRLSDLLFILARAANCPREGSRSRCGSRGPTAPRAPDGGSQAGFAARALGGAGASGARPPAGRPRRARSTASPSR